MILANPKMKEKPDEACKQYRCNKECRCSNPLSHLTWLTTQDHCHARGNNRYQKWVKNKARKKICPPHASFPGVVFRRTFTNIPKPRIKRANAMTAKLTPP
jgi:hypothetical protein